MYSEGSHTSPNVIRERKEKAILPQVWSKPKGGAGMMVQGRRNVSTSGPAKLDHEDYAIKFMGGQQLHEY